MNLDSIFEQMATTMGGIDKNYAGAVEKLKKHVRMPVFRICVIGGFSRGKSRFINDLLGERILPESAVPTTTCLTEISYGDMPALEIVEKGIARKEPFSIASIQEISLNANGKNLLLKIFYPAKFLKNGLVLLDTPGFDDILSSASEITIAALENADAVVAMLSAISPLGLGERNFIEMFQKEKAIPLMAAAISFLDGLPEDNRVNQLQFIIKKCAFLYPDMQILVPQLSQNPFTDQHIICGIQDVISFMKNWRNLPDYKKLQVNSILYRLGQITASALVNLSAEKQALESTIAKEKQKLDNSIEELDDKSEEIDLMRIEFSSTMQILFDKIKKQIKLFEINALNNSREISADDMTNMAIKFYQQIISLTRENLKQNITKLSEKMTKIYGIPLNVEISRNMDFLEIPVNNISAGEEDKFNIMDSLFDKAVILLDAWALKMPAGVILWPIIKPFAVNLLALAKTWLNSSQDQKNRLEKEISIMGSTMFKKIKEPIEAVYKDVFEEIRLSRKNWLKTQQEKLRSESAVRSLAESLAILQNNIHAVDNLKEKISAMMKRNNGAQHG